MIYNALITWAILMMFIVFYVVIKAKKEKISILKGLNIRPKRTFTPRSLDELLNILNFTIEKEIMFRLKIELELKRSTRMITKFNEELSSLSRNVVDALGEEYLYELGYYYKTEYILKYIVKTVQLYLIKYMDDNKITTK